jgi:hypothetical protein
VCGTYDYFQDKNCLNIRFLCGRLCVFFSVGADVNVYVVLCGCFVCVLRGYYVCMFFFLKNSTLFLSLFHPHYISMILSLFFY